MVSLEGIVTKCSLVRPKVIKSVHYNEKKSIFRFREYRDQTMTVGATTTSVYPQQDEEGDPVCKKSADDEHLLISPSLSQNMAIARIGTTKRFPFKRCQKGRRQGSYPEV